MIEYAIIIFLIIAIAYYYYYNKSSFISSPTEAATKLYNANWRIHLSTSCPLCLSQARIFYPRINIDDLDKYPLFVMDPAIKQPIWTNGEVKLIGPFSLDQVEHILNANIERSAISGISNALVDQLYIKGWRLHVDLKSPPCIEQLSEIFDPIPDFTVSPCKIIIDIPNAYNQDIDNEYGRQYDDTKIIYPFWTNVFDKSIKKGMMKYNQLSNI